MKIILSCITLIIALVFGSYFYDLKSNEELKEEFSKALIDWFNKGNYFMYKDIYRIFYIEHELNTDESINLPSVIFLHGFPTNSYDFNKVFNLFKNEKNFKSIILFDYLGYGFSDKPLNYEYTIFDMADQVDKILIHLNIQNAYLIAHDISDTVAQELVRRHNLNHQNHFNIEKLVLLNGGLFTDIYRPILSQDLMRTTFIKDIFSKYFFKFIFFKSTFRKIFGNLNELTNQELLDFYNTIRYNQGNLVLPLTINYMNERVQYEDVWTDALNETMIPSMFIYGPADPINPRNKFPQKIRTDLPNVKFILLSDLVGHYPQYEDSFTVFELIRKFFN